MKTLFANRFLSSSLLALASLLLTPSARAQSNAPLVTTFANPSPAAFDLFGSTMAGMGNDRVLVAAGGAGAYYLLSTGGTVLATFTNPNPAATFIANSMTAVGSDRVLVAYYEDNLGAVQTGAAYLFNTNGLLVTTFTNPTPASGEAFGWAVAAVGNQRVLIGALADNLGATASGAAYLFNTNGLLLATISNPTPANNDGFGGAVAVLGSDRLIIGASSDDNLAGNSGMAYLFRTNGTLITSFTNPTPAVGDEFGVSVAAVGSDRVLVGANRGHAGVSGAGAAYLFTTNGTLLTTFISPTPTVSDNFGYTVAAVGSSRVLIGAYGQSIGASQAGAAYLFSTNGTLLNTFTNPTPAVNDWFGQSVAALGTDSVLVGAVWDDTGATDSGAAYLYALPYPALSIARGASAVNVQWITSETGLTLQQADVLGTPTVWSNATNAITLTGRTNAAQPSTTGGTTNRFYRLRRM